MEAFEGIDLFDNHLPQRITGSAALEADFEGRLHHDLRMLCWTMFSEDMQASRWSRPSAPILNRSDSGSDRKRSDWLLCRTRYQQLLEAPEEAGRRLLRQVPGNLGANAVLYPSWQQGP